MTYIAHIQSDPNGGHQLHSLEEHLLAVAQQASGFAKQYPIGSKAWAYLAGLWHDLGKYSPAFQARIQSLSQEAQSAHLEGQPHRVNHSSAGALHAQLILGKTAGKLLGYLIAGHHCGLPDWEYELDRRLHWQDSQNQALYQAAVHSDTPTTLLKPTDTIKHLNLPAIIHPSKHRLAPSFWLRMLFSCLVDADFLDTEAFMNPNRSQARQSFPSMGKLVPVLNQFLPQFKQQVQPTPVNVLRQEILEVCLTQTHKTPGIYTLTVPTGGGKTFTSLAWAMHHAQHHGQTRIVYVLPYTSILEQTAEQFESVFGPNTVVEHHSNLDLAEESAQSRLACENWDAPVILTTQVQFFESLFANRTSRCRKLHRIANSVVILDEVQQIPPAFKAPIEAALTLLAEQYGTTILLSTATQPVLNLPIQAELAPDPIHLLTQLNRVRIHLPFHWTQPKPWQTLAAELCNDFRVLCIVNSRSDAKRLFQAMPQEGTYHLSARMCPAHRQETLRTIQFQLQANSKHPIRVISTSLIEAGVDIDFPVVYRALAGLDSIAQAAGRCNREGRLPQGQVHVFIPESPIPVGYQRKAAQITRLLLHQQTELILSPALFSQYFTQLYGSLNSDDPHGILELLAPQDGKPHFAFRSAARQFQLLDHPEEVPILIPWNQQAQELLTQLAQTGPTRFLLRSLQRYTVTLPRSQAKQLQADGGVLEVQSGLLQLVDLKLYSPDTGLSPSRIQSKTA